MFASDLRHPRPALEDKLHALYRLTRGDKISLGFRKPYLDLLRKFGNPHKHLPPTIHVAGTNGKGSTIAFLRTMLEAEGYSVHVYTSPHMARFNERIVLAGKEIGDEPLEALVDEALALNAGADVTFFEITTALAFTAFARARADILLLETGLGGRLDCTNVIESPLVSIITPIGYDHMEHLGCTLHAITCEKGGIIKKNAPCVIGPQGSGLASEEIIDALRPILKSNDSKGFIHGADWFTEPSVDRFQFITPEQRLIYPNPAMPGAFQIQNAATALAALEVIENKFPVSNESKMTGLRTARWPGRLQRLSHGPLTGLLPPGTELWLDGAHNENAAKALAAQLEIWAHEDNQPIFAVLGMMNHKDPAAFTAPLRPYVRQFYAIPVPGEPAGLEAVALAAKIPGAKVANNTEEALRDIAAAETPCRVLIVGSLYLAGHVLQANG